MALLIVQQGPKTGKSFLIDSERCLIGRGNKCHIQIPDRSVSRNHATIYQDEKGVYHLVDMKST